MSDFCVSGICPVPALSLDRPARARLDRLCPDARTVMVYFFPYYSGIRPGNLSLYARGRDYHAVIRETLAPLAQAFQARRPGSRFVVLADDSPLPEVRAASLAGLGAVGENGLLIQEEYGSYGFLGTIVTDLLIPAEPHAPRPCLRCGRCRTACPTGAVTGSGIDPGRCLSALTQRGGNVTPEEAEQLRRHPLIWGCDICQQVCPMNRDVKWTETAAFRTGLIDTLTLERLDGLTRRTFPEKFPDRAFTWRGPAPLRRNLALKAERPNPKPEET